MSERLIIPNSLLKFPNVKIEESYISKDPEIIIKVSSTENEISCHKCGALCQPHGHGETCRIAHLESSINK